MDETSIAVRPSLWAQLFAGAGHYQCATLARDGIQITAPGRRLVLPYGELQEIRRADGVFWSTLTLVPANGPAFALSGIPVRRTDSLWQRIAQRHSAARAATLLREHGALLRTLTRWLRQCQEGTRWVAHNALQFHLEAARPLGPLLTLEPEALTDDPQRAGEVGAVRAFVADPGAFRKAANTRFVAAELERFRGYLDRVESKPLTPAQRLAVITHEDNTRVIAGAGSGKTSVIVAKAGYLLEAGLCRPEQLLLLAFNANAAKELAERVRARVGADVRACTFHALGLGILAEVEGRKPTLSRIAGNDEALAARVRELLGELVLEPRTARAVRTYFQSFFAPERSAPEFATLGDYYAYLRDRHLVTLRGERVKSFAEAEIANWLCLHGIPYRYEPPYEIDVADRAHRQYQPDFHLPEHGLYIEHFGIDRDGATAPGIDAEAYAAGMAWKRALHATHGTRLIETFQWERQEGTLLEELERKLRAAEVVPAPLTPQEVVALLQECTYIDPFSRLAATFINHLKGDQRTLAEVRAVARERSVWSPRLEAFLAVVEPLLGRYEASLRAEGAIDFNDMISRAAAHARSGAYRSPYTCLLVDEFQDISRGRARLISALKDQAPDHRLFAVGDDWQAIYRFAGSDIALMRDFEHHFGATETVALDQTFRFNDRIERVATRFVLANPAQIRKTVRAPRREDSPRVVVHSPTGEGEDLVAQAFAAIARSAPCGKAQVLALGRYRFLADNPDWAALGARHRGLETHFRTVHAAKGLEADYVVVLGMQAGRYGFPSEIVDDPVLNAVLAAPEPFPNAEERRLFYVALTRARHAVHVIADGAAPSPFVSEILGYAGEVMATGQAAAVRASCPVCTSGVLVQRTGPYGVFYGCAHFPYCTYTTPPCPRCGAGVLIRRDARFYVCANSACAAEIRACPSCADGRLVQREGRHGPFLGCTNYARGDCRHTENL